MVPDPARDEAGPMTTNTPGPPDAPVDDGPRVTSDELRNLARLRRSRSDKKIAGVAGGISRHLDIDPIITRVALVVLVFFGGAGVILYVACWLIVPIDGEAQATLRLDDRSRVVALALVGVVAALALLGDSLGGWGFPWPLATIGAVVVLVMLVRGHYDRKQAQPQPAASGATGTPGVGAQPGWVQPQPQPAGYAATYPTGRPKRRGPLLFWYTAAIIAIAVGVLGSIDLAGVGIAESAYPAIGLISSGAMLVVGAFWGRPGGLILLGLLSAVATAGVATVNELDAGRIDRTPASTSTLLSDYDLDLGEIVLDLTEISDPAALDTRTIDLEVGLGRVEVIVPDGVAVTVNSDLGAGDSSIFGNDGDGGTETTTLDDGAGAPSLTLDVTVGLGEIDITREGAN
ncbi:PspC domain-containing protein [soil metagenome]